MAYKLTDVLRFGKHKGEIVKDVIKDDPTYIEWALDNIDWFELGDKADAQYQKAIDKYYADSQLNELGSDWGDGHWLDFGDA